MAEIPRPNGEGISGSENYLLNKCHIDVIGYEADKAELCQKTLEFVEKLSAKFGEYFMSIIGKYASTEERRVKIIKYLKNNNFEMPRFIVIGNQTLASNKLKELDLPTIRRFENSINMIMLMPKPLEKFYYKRNEAEPANDYNIPWGDILSELSSYSWHHIENAAEEHGISIYRINTPGQHVPNNFYYAFEVAENNANMIYHKNEHQEEDQEQARNIA
ncbi:MAG: hypothetical protein BWY19_00627 [bacterium ADurb.Bin212]|nr:MAG: hypothetical protein BWY19_00627 [bacterium ADurb.Bin212]